MSFIKMLGFDKVRFIEEERIIFSEEALTKIFAYKVICKITKHCRKEKDKQKQEEIQRADSSKCPCCKQEGIYWKKGSNDKSSFQKNDEEENEIDPKIIMFNDFLKMNIEMKDYI